MTHNFPSLKERTKMVSFFIVTSSWQSGEMTLLHRNKRCSRVQMSWSLCVCVCVRWREKGACKAAEGSGCQSTSQWLKYFPHKGHADELQNIAWTKHRLTRRVWQVRADEKWCMREGCVHRQQLLTGAKEHNRGTYFSARFNPESGSAAVMEI